LYRFALSFVSNEADAKDVVQDVMIKSWQRIEDIDAIKNLEAWCITMTKNRCLDLIRKKGRHNLDLDDQLHIASREPSPLEKTVTDDSMKRIESLIEDLPDNQRAVITLRDIEGYTYKEIAKILELDMNHVKVLLHRSRMAIKSKLEGLYTT